MTNYISIDDKFRSKDGITFDDVLLQPNYTSQSRRNIKLETVLHPKIKLKLPVISSPMDTVTGSKLAIAMANAGGVGVIHRNQVVDDQVAEIETVKSAEVLDSEMAAIDDQGRLLVGAALNVSGDDFVSDVQRMVGAGVDFVVFDTAHGHAYYIVDAVKKLRDAMPDLPIVAGNITTAEAAKDLHEAGANILRVGMGPGSICTTRIVTGIGVPQLSAVADVASYARENGLTLIADGGIKQIGDMAKAIGFGAHCVMLGSMLAGFDQSLGDTIDINGEKYKSYRGMGSSDAMEAGSANRYGQEGKVLKHMVSEGVAAMVKYKGDVVDFLEQIRGGLVSSFYYVGAYSVDEFYDKARFVRITPAGMSESHPHSITGIKGESSYL